MYGQGDCQTVSWKSHKSAHILTLLWRKFIKGHFQLVRSLCAPVIGSHSFFKCLLTPSVYFKEIYHYFNFYGNYPKISIGSLDSGPVASSQCLSKNKRDTAWMKILNQNKRRWSTLRKTNWQICHITLVALTIHGWFDSSPIGQENNPQKQPCQQLMWWFLPVVLFQAFPFSWTSTVSSLAFPWSLFLFFLQLLLLHLVWITLLNATCSTGATSGRGNPSWVSSVGFKC